jgi:hypothetical protein
MIERYLEPLMHQTFLSHEDIRALVGQSQEILEFQRDFHKALEQTINPNLSKFDDIMEFKVGFGYIWAFL